MGVAISRRKIASYVADQYMAGTSMGTLLKEVAAYLLETKQTRSAEVMVRDIEEALERRGVLIARVTTARGMTEDLKSQLSSWLGADDIHLAETTDKSVLGGVLVETPSRRLDATITQRIRTLQQAKQ